MPGAAQTARRKRGSPTPGPSAKRARHGDGSAKPASPDARIDEIDLSDDKVTVQEVLQKQRVDAVKAQTRPEEKPTTFNSFTCVICMDTPTDITATSCGEWGGFCVWEAVMLIVARPSVLPYLSYGGPDCGREPRGPERAEALAVSGLQEVY